MGVTARTPSASPRRGGATRQRILSAAAALSVDRAATGNAAQGASGTVDGRTGGGAGSGAGAGELSVAAIARAAGVYPNQITHHFGSKDALLVEAAFLALLRDSQRVRNAGASATSPEAFRRRIARTVLTMPSLQPAARALAAAIAKPELAGVVDTHLQLLFAQSERYLALVLERQGWRTEHPIAIEVRTFWSAALGAVLLSRAGVHGDTADIDLAGTLTVG